ncbi:MAG: peptidoglycan LD-endopeptidase LytH [Solirubrobacterales bacterium]|jgi:murein DD-endopeptidase MepM/ murein hydrolase activator NlpD|nr:peptidoglycan LD-endopeptidase LytH [Solirubrobacterales bacterium]
MSFTFTATVLLMLCLAASAAATTGGAPTAASVPAAAGSPSGTPASEAPSAGTLSLVSAQATPRKSFFYGFRYPSVRFSIASTQPQNDLQIDVVNAASEVVRSFYRNDVEPNSEVRIRWDGTTAEGRPARNGRYSFRIGPQGGTEVAARVATSSEPLSLGFALYGYAFPVLGAHDFGGAAGRFGAARSGHTHQGQDTMADCGTPLVAARGGTVQYAGYQYAAGNYVVIDGKGTTLDFMYAHLAEPSPLKTGDAVRTGQPIGIVGDTGDATACHLHFEIWTAPGWYEGGSPIDPLPYLEKWDAYS